MLEEIIYKIIDNKVKELEKSDYDNSTLGITMKANIEKYLHSYTVGDAKTINLVKPTETDMVMYLIYLLHKQKLNDLESLTSLQDILDFKISVHNGELNSQEIRNLIDMYKLQIKLK